MKSWWALPVPGVAPFIAGSGAWMAGKGAHSRGGVAQGSGCWSAGLEVFPCCYH